VLGFYRIYSFPWRPQENADYLPLSGDQARERTGGRLPGFQPRDDSGWEHCEANRRQGEEYLRVLLEEAGEHTLIGEDLGVVPDYVRPSLTSLGIAGFKIPTWENGNDGRLAEGKNYQRLSLTTYATHDHPPLKTLWDDLHGAAISGNGHAQWELKRLADFAGITANPLPAFNDEIHAALLAALLRSNSWIAVLMITDLFGSTQRFNVPGAVADSNWSERLPDPVAKWRTNADIAAKTALVKRLLRETGRTGE
jgi:4-alpha-glucanotransferase